MSGTIIGKFIRPLKESPHRCEPHTDAGKRDDVWRCECGKLWLRDIDDWRPLRRRELKRVLLDEGLGFYASPVAHAPKNPEKDLRMRAH